MKRALIGIGAALIPLMGVLLAAPAHAASENKALVIKDGVGFYCTDGYGNYTADAIKVATKSGQVNLTCRFAAGTTNWPLGERHREDVEGDCFTNNFYGVRVALDSHFEVTPNGAAVMTCS